MRFDFKDLMSFGMFLIAFPRATSQVGILVCTFGDCRESQIPEEFAR